MPSLKLDTITDQHSGDKESGGTDYEVNYVAICDTIVNASAIQALLPYATPETLAIGDDYPGDSSSKCRHIKVERKDESKTVWKVTAQFLRPERGSLHLPPLDRPPEIRWYLETETRSIFWDHSSPPVPVVNSAGEKFDELPQRPFGEFALNYTRNMANADTDLALFREAAYVVNSTPFTIDGRTIPAKVALLAVVDCPKIIEGQYTFYRVTYQLWFKSIPDPENAGQRLGWNPTKVLDYGYQYLGGISGDKRATIPDSDGMPIRKPWPLDGLGGTMPNPDDPAAWRSFKFFEEIDFSAFNFT